MLGCLGPRSVNWSIFLEKLFISSCKTLQGQMLFYQKSGTNESITNWNGQNFQIHSCWKVSLVFLLEGWEAKVMAHGAFSGWLPHSGKKKIKAKLIDLPPNFGLSSAGQSCPWSIKAWKHLLNFNHITWQNQDLGGRGTRIGGSRGPWSHHFSPAVRASDRGRGREEWVEGGLLGGRGGVGAGPEGMEQWLMVVRNEKTVTQ